MRQSIEKASKNRHEQESTCPSGSVAAFGTYVCYHDRQKSIGYLIHNDDPGSFSGREQESSLYRRLGRTHQTIGGAALEDIGHGNENHKRQGVIEDLQAFWVAAKPSILPFICRSLLTIRC